jgi:hypothetical protein
MTSIVVSTIAFFVASWFIKRRLEQEDIPKGMTLNLIVFVLALAVSYGVAAAVDWVAAHV